MRTRSAAVGPSQPGHGRRHRPPAATRCGHSAGKNLCVGLRRRLPAVSGRRSRSRSRPTAGDRPDPRARGAGPVGLGEPQSCCRRKAARTPAHQSSTPTRARALACASCHAEGLDDGRVWNFACVGRAPHPVAADGAARDGAVPLERRREGLPDAGPRRLHHAHVGPGADRADQRTRRWPGSTPSLASPRSGHRGSAAVARGQAVFARRACATCHAGEHLTNGQTVDVGTGGAFQVPSLVGLATHPPYLHDGCAATLAGRFDPSCGGDRHGLTSSLALVGSPTW